MAMNDSQLITEAIVIKTETSIGANTATRVGTMLENIIDNKINDDKIDTDGTFAANSDTVIPSQKATKTYITGQVTTINGSIVSGLALKENTANKSNGPLGSSPILFPTESSVKTYVDTQNALDEKIADKVTTSAQVISNGTSVIKYPAVKAIKDYVDTVTTGLLKDNGNYDPTVTGDYPTSANTLSGGNPLTGDLWYIDTAGTMNGNAVLVGYSVRALVDNPGATTDADWAIANVGLGYVPENSANKSNDGTFNSGSPSATQFPTQFAVATYVAANAPSPNLQTVLFTNGRALSNGRNFQGTGSGNGNLGFDVNAFGTSSATNNSGSNVNAFGVDSGYDNTGANLNSFGYAASQNNTGDNVNALGYAAAANNTGDNVNGIGLTAAAFNLGNYVNAFGPDAANGNTGNDVNAFGLLAGASNAFNNVSLFGASAQAGADDQLVFSNGAGLNARISNAGLTLDRTYQLPDQSGIIALTSQLSLQTITIDIPQSQLAAGGFVQLIPPPGVNKIIHVISGSCSLISATPFSSFPTPFVSLVYNPAFVQIGYAVALDIISKFSTFSISSQNSSIASLANTSVQLSIPVGITGGSNTLRVSLQYTTVEVA